MARWSLVGDEAIAPHFKRHGDAWIFRAHGWASPDRNGRLSLPLGIAHFVVTDAQKAAIEPIVRSVVRVNAVMTIAAMVVAAAIVWGAGLLLGLGSILHGFVVVAFVLAWLPLSLVLFVAIGHRGMRRRQEELRTVLAGAPRTEQGMSKGDRLSAFALAISTRKLVLGLLLFGFILVSDVRRLIQSLQTANAAGPMDWIRFGSDVFGAAFFAGIFLLLVVTVVIRARTRRGTTA